MGFALALVAVVTFTAHGKNLTAQAEETAPTLAKQVAISLSVSDVEDGTKYKEVGVGEEINKNTRFYVRVSPGGVNPLTYWYSDNYAIFIEGLALKIVQFEEPGKTYGSMAEVGMSARLKEEQLVPADKFTDATVYAFNMLVDFGELKGLSDMNASLIYVEVDDGTTTPDDGTTTPDDGTTTPDDGTTTPDDGTTTPDDDTTTPDDDKEEPKDDVMNKFSDWLNSTFGFNTSGNLIGSLALLLAGVFILKAIFGKK